MAIHLLVYLNERRTLLGLLTTKVNCGKRHGGRMPRGRAEAVNDTVLAVQPSGTESAPGIGIVVGNPQDWAEVLEW